jgi:tetratricopeptide (TPR) repeat protein
MTVSQPYRANFLRMARNATFAFAILAWVPACSDSLENAVAQGSVAEQHLANGQVRAARLAINKAIGERDDIVELHLLRGRIELAAGATGSAYDAYSDALSLDPANREALQGVSQLGLSTGHIPESLEATEQILSLDPGAPNALIVRGVHALVRRRADEAIGYAEKVLASAAAANNETIRADAAILKSRALFLKGDHDGALAAVNDPGNGAAVSAALALTKLEIFRELRQPSAMAEQFAVLHRLRPDDGELRLDEANMRFKLGERELANRLVIATLMDTKTTREGTAAAIRLLEEYGVDGISSEQVQLIGQRGSPGAREAMTRFLIENGAFPAARILLRSLAGNTQRSLAARLEGREGRHRAALGLAEAVLAQDATHCDALIAKSEANLAIGAAETALISGQQAAAECPSQPAAWIAAANAYTARERPSGAERVYRQAIESYPQSLRLAREYAEWLLGNDRKREAVATARRLTRSSPALLTGWRFYADVCRRAGAPCQREAEQGLEDAKTIYGVDIETGRTLPHGLVGRLRR